MKKIFVFDFDNTLIHTDARIKITNGKESRYTDSYGYALNEGEYYDYSEFDDIEYIRAGKDTFLIYLVQEVHAENHDIYILTARGPKSIPGISEYLSRHGVVAKDIICLNGENSLITAQKKRDVLLTLMDSCDKLYYYDDSHENINHAPVHPKMRSYKI